MKNKNRRAIMFMQGGDEQSRRALMRREEAKEDGLSDRRRARQTDRQARQTDRQTGRVRMKPRKNRRTP